jgi:hypothetical protein
LEAQRQGNSRALTFVRCIIDADRVVDPSTIPQSDSKSQAGQSEDSQLHAYTN